MSAVRRLAALLAFAAGVTAQDPESVAVAQRAHGAVSVRVDGGRERRFVGEAAAVRVEVRFDRAFFRDHAAPLFQRQLDVPLQVKATWLDGGDAATALPERAQSGGARSRIVVNERVVAAEALADVVEDGRTFGVLTFSRRLAPRRAGRVELEAPRVRFAAATQFRDDFVNGRVPVDRIDCEVVGAPSSWSVEDVPQAGRPASFCGAVGVLQLEAKAASTQVGADGRIEVTLVVRGDGDLASWSLPQLAIPGFYVLGALDRGGKNERAFALELELLDASLSAVPPIELASFDAESATFVVAATAPVAFEVTAPLASRATVAVGSRATDAPAIAGSSTNMRAEDFDAPSSRALPPDAQRLSDAFVVASLAAPWALCICAMALRARRRRAVPPVDPLAAAAAFELAAANGSADLLEPYESWIAARCGIDALPVADADVEAALAHAGLPGELALRAVALRRSLSASRYKGMSAAARVAAQRFVEEAERAFAAAGANGGAR